MDTDTRQKQIDGCFSKLESILKILSATEHKNIIGEVKCLLGVIKNHVADLIKLKQSSSDSISCLDPSDLTGWKYLGEGKFGEVLECQMKGSKVAVKILKSEAKNQFRESKLLRYLSHGNIVGYRGMGYIPSSELEKIRRTNDEDSMKLLRDEKEYDSGHSTQSESSNDSDSDIPMFIAMEFVEKNLFQYVHSLETHENHGLSESHTWNIGKQIASALDYLHSIKVVHRDLKPDNILIEFGPRKIVVKIADFGLAWYSGEENLPANPSSCSSKTSYVKMDSSFYLNIRWGAPELYRAGTFTMEDYMHGDIFSMGLVLAFTLTGIKALAHLSSGSLEDLDELPGNKPINLPKSLEGSLRKSIEHCVNEAPQLRPSAEFLVKKYFGSDKNPYEIDPSSVEFFSCGFLEKTDIYVADSFTDERSIYSGIYYSDERLHGYDHQDLVCPIETEKAPYRFDDEADWPEEETAQYQDNLRKYLTMAKKKEIDNNPTVALKGLTLARPGEEEKQTIEFQFKESDYCHHRAMREIWMSMSLRDKNLAVPCKGDVHPLFSNSFGLHVAILTNEGPDKPQKFIFPQRSKRKGMAAPGNYTCGAVESASKPDYVTKTVDGRSLTYVNLVHTAARGLMEEIGLELTGQDLDAICLTTVYLKFDTHEWGLCGFVDLKDERIAPEHRISADELMDRFTSGPKDKFEHHALTPVEFKLEPMIKFVSENHQNFASSAKLVVVKVLQAFFGWQKVQREFKLSM